MIPDAALDDRIGWVGTSGSGKTYGAGTAVERILNRRGRCIIVDPLGVWWGARLLADGVTPSKFDVVIFGGPHGDLPLTEYAGALIGETVAGMKESVIVDLSEIGTKAGERRFMLEFLTALHRKTAGDPVHVIFDEADMWAPQVLRDKEGGVTPKLLGMMETIVRRGRVKGFIPWLITQRPAVVSKDVLSQVDALVAFKLTSSQDRDALEGWIEGQADKGQWKEIRAQLPTMERGRGVIWIPGRDVLETKAFPPKVTFDSSRTPKRGEAKRVAELKPLDVGALRDKLATLKVEVEANDPKVLRKQIVELERDLVNAQKLAPAADPQTLQAEFVKGMKAAVDIYDRKVRPRVVEVLRYAKQAAGDAESALTALDEITSGDAYAANVPAAPDTKPQAHVAPARAPTHTDSPRAAPARSTTTPAAGERSGGSAGPSKMRVMVALAENPAGLNARKLAILADVGRGGSTWRAIMAALRRDGHVEDDGSFFRLTPAGLSALGPFTPLPKGAALREHWLGKMGGGSRRDVFKIILDAYPKEIAATEVAAGSGVELGGSTWRAHMAYLRGLELIEGRGELRAAEALFQ